MAAMKRPRKDGTMGWQVIVRAVGGKTITKTFDDKGEAEMFEEMLKKEMQATKLRMALAARQRRQKPEMSMKLLPAETAGNDADEAKRIYDEELLVETLKKYAQCSEIAPKTKASLPSVVKTVGDVRLGELKKRWVKKYIEHLREVPTQYGKPREYATIQGYMSVINCALRWRAEDLDLTPVPLPFSKRTMFPRNCFNGRERRLDRDEELALFHVFKELKATSHRHYRLLIRFALETGARLQEMVLAEWKEFDIEKRVWRIPAEHVKTGMGRLMPLNRKALRVLRAMWKMRDESKTRVFHLLDKPKTVSTIFGRFSRKAGLVDFRFHDLRHEAISRMVLKQRKLSVDMIMKMVGHSSLAMLRRYTNLRPEEIIDRMI